MTDQPSQPDRLPDGCCSAFMMPVVFFVASVIAVAIAVVTNIINVTWFEAAIYIFGLQVLFLLLFTVYYLVQGVND